MSTREVTVSITGGKRTIFYMNRVKANLPKLSAELVRFGATSVKNKSQANVRARSKYDKVDYMENLSRKNHSPGLLAESINILSLNNTENGNKAVIGIEPSSLAAEYAGVVEVGRPGGVMIYPSKEKLKFSWIKAGGWVYPHKVRQGSQRPMYYMRDAVLETAETIRGKLHTESDMLLKK